MELKLKGKWRCAGVLGDIFSVTGEDFIRKYEWTVNVEEANRGTRAIPVSEWNRDMRMTGDQLVDLSKEDVQFIDAEFKAFQDSRRVFTLKSVDSTLWVVDSEDRGIIRFFRKKFP